MISPQNDIMYYYININIYIYTYCINSFFSFALVCVFSFLLFALRRGASKCWTLFTVFHVRAHTHTQKATQDLTFWLLLHHTWLYIYTHIYIYISFPATSSSVKSYQLVKVVSGGRAPGKSLILASPQLLMIEWFHCLGAVHLEKVQFSFQFVYYGNF